MSTHVRNPNGPILHHPAQRGAALIVSLLFLLVLTVLGMSSINSSIMEERMSGNSADRQRAFQAAEAALRSGEIYLRDNKPVLDEACTDGVCTNYEFQTIADWRTDLNHAAWAQAKTVSDEVFGGSGTAKKAQYIIEDMCEFTPDDTGIVDSKRMFRITAVGYGASENTIVMLESSFVKDNNYGVGNLCDCGHAAVSYADYCTNCPGTNCPTPP